MNIWHVNRWTALRIGPPWYLSISFLRTMVGYDIDTWHVLVVLLNFLVINSWGLLLVRILCDPGKVRPRLRWVQCILAFESLTMNLDKLRVRIRVVCFNSASDRLWLHALVSCALVMALRSPCQNLISIVVVVMVEVVRVLRLSLLCNLLLINVRKQAFFPSMNYFGWFFLSCSHLFLVV